MSAFDNALDVTAHLVVRMWHVFLAGVALLVLGLYLARVGFFPADGGIGFFDGLIGLAGALLVIGSMVWLVAAFATAVGIGLHAMGGQGVLTGVGGPQIPNTVAPDATLSPESDAAWRAGVTSHEDRFASIPKF